MNWLNSKRHLRIHKITSLILKKNFRNKKKKKKKEFKRKFRRRKKLFQKSKKKRDIQKDVSNVVLDNIFSETVQQTRVGDFVINAGLQTIIIEIVQNKHMNLLTVFIVERKDTLQDNVPITRRDYTEKEVLALAVVL